MTGSIERDGGGEGGGERIVRPIEKQNYRDK